MKKDKLSKEAAKLDKKLKELAKTTTRKFTQVQSGGDYQFHGTTIKSKEPETKKQKWILGFSVQNTDFLFFDMGVGGL